MSSDVLRQVRTLSSGTMASLTGLRRYDEIDAERERFYGWTRGRLGEGETFDNWMQAWNRRQAEEGRA